MKMSFLMIALFFFVSSNCQTILSPQFGISSQSRSVINYPQDSLSTPKWFFSSYRGLSTSVSFFRGGNATIFSAPMGLQLNRRINNNFYAFANVTGAPAYININSTYAAGLNKNFSNSPFNQNGFRLYPAASLGLMYVNDAKTFSISGSISAEKTMYPGVPYFPVNQTTQSPVLLQNNK